MCNRQWRPRQRAGRVRIQPTDTLPPFATPACIPHVRDPCCPRFNLSTLLGTPSPLPPHSALSARTRGSHLPQHFVLLFQRLTLALAFLRLLSTNPHLATVLCRRSARPADSGGDASASRRSRPAPPQVPSCLAPCACYLELCKEGDAGRESQIENKHCRPPCLRQHGARDRVGCHAPAHQRHCYTRSAGCRKDQSDHLPSAAEGLRPSRKFPRLAMQSVSPRYQ